MADHKHNHKDHEHNSSHNTSHNKGKSILSAFGKMKSDRTPFEQYWRDAFDYTFPLRGQGFQHESTNVDTMIANADRNIKELFDITGRDAARILASSVLSGSTPASMKWFSLIIPTLDNKEIPHDAKVWLDQVANRMFQLIHASNYDGEAFELVLDMVIGGWAGLFIEIKEGQGLRFEFVPGAGLYIDDRLKKGRIDTVYRLVKLTAADAIKKFGVSVVSGEVQREAKEDPWSSKTFDFVHCVIPRVTLHAKGPATLTENMPWESTWVEVKTESVVRESGFNSFPYIIPRWSKVPNSAYAMGAVYDAMPEIKMVNKMREFLIQHAETVIAPPLTIVNDGTMQTAQVVFAPHQPIVIEEQGDVQVLNMGGDFSVGKANIDDSQAIIKKILMADQLEPFDGPQISATQAEIRARQIRSILGPVFARIQSEFLAPLIERVFDLLLREGELGEVPEALKGADINPTYQSPLARSQKIEDLAAMDRFEESLARQIQAGFTAAADNYNIDLAVRMRAELGSIPKVLIQSEREVKLIREARAKAELEEQKALQEAALIEAAKED